MKTMNAKQKCIFKIGVVIGNIESDGCSSIGLAETSSVYNIYAQFSSKRAGYHSVIFNLFGTELIVIIITVMGVYI
jgi:hypothetical protein